MSTPQKNVENAEAKEESKGSEAKVEDVKQEATAAPAPATIGLMCGNNYFILPVTGTGTDDDPFVIP